MGGGILQDQVGLSYKVLEGVRLCRVQATSCPIKCMVVVLLVGSGDWKCC